MITIQIGDTVKDYKDATEHWIAQQIRDRRAAGESICVRLTIKHGSLNFVLQTPGCPVFKKKSRRLRPSEQEVHNLWEHYNLNTEEFTQGNLIAFLKQLRRWVGY